MYQKNIKIIIPNINNVRNIDNLWSCLNFISNEIEEIELNFKEISFLNPMAILSLQLFILQLKNYGVPIALREMNSKVSSYLERVNFFSETGRYSNSNKLIELDRLKNPVDVAYLVLKLQTFLSNWIPDDKYETYRAEIKRVVMEICNNSIEHSRLDGNHGECLFILQKYKLGNEKYKVCLAIGDIGVGVRRHIINRYPKWGNLMDKEVIHKIMLGNTGRMTGKGGFGLQKVQEITKKYQGSMFLRSGKGSVSIVNNHLVGLDWSFPIPGTCCYIELKSEEW